MSYRSGFLSNTFSSTVEQSASLPIKHETIPCTPHGYSTLFLGGYDYVMDNLCGSFDSLGPRASLRRNSQWIHSYPVGHRNRCGAIACDTRSPDRVASFDELLSVSECGIGFQPVICRTQAGSLCHLFPERCLIGLCSGAQCKITAPEALADFVI